MTTLERMARAMCGIDGIEPDAASLGRDMKIRTAVENRIIELRAVFEVEPSEEAMRAAEQTDSMKFVAMVLLQAQNHGMGELPEGTRIVRDVWQAMRTAILEGRA